MKTYTVSVQAIVCDEYTIEARDADEAAKAAAVRANNHLRDDGELLSINTELLSINTAVQACDYPSVPVPNL